MESTPTNATFVSAADAGVSPSPPDRSIRATLARLFGVDLRALAALRIGLALVVLVDLVPRFSTVPWFLADTLFFSRDLSRQVTPPTDGYWSLYWWDGSPAWAYLLLALNGLAAVCLALGFKTRVATWACLVLAWSLQVRMPLVLTAGHVLLRMLLVWLVFLPCGRVWSLDARRLPAPLSWRVVSVATAGLLLQVAVLYLFSGIAKWNEVWLRGDAIHLAMQLDMYVKPWGRNLLAWPSLCTALTWGTLLLEIAGPLLLFMPIATRQLRAILCVAFYGLHVGIWLAMSIGIFSLVAMVAWIPLWPVDFWPWLGKRISRSTAVDRAAPPVATFPLRRSPLITACASSVLLYTIFINLANLDPPRTVRWFPRAARMVGNALMLTQEFKMFDRPSSWTYAWRLVQPVEPGHWLDSFGGQTRRCAAPAAWPTGEEIFASFPSHAWRRLFFNLAYFGDQSPQLDPSLSALRERLGVAVIESWSPHAAAADTAAPRTLLRLRKRLDRWAEPGETEVEVWARD